MTVRKANYFSGFPSVLSRYLMTKCHPNHYCMELCKMYQIKNDNSSKLGHFFMVEVSQYLHVILRQ
jgi:hypothetical protein